MPMWVTNEGGEGEEMRKSRYLGKVGRGPLPATQPH